LADAAATHPPPGISPARTAPESLLGPPPVVAPLTPARFRIQFTIDQETHETLRQVQDLLRREVPDGDLAAIFGRALNLLLERTASQKLAAVVHPRPLGDRHRHRSRHLPAQLVRAVWKRDGAQCAFVARSGRRCGARAFLEFHHVDAFALGGETTEANVSLRCRTHNQYEAELVFGRFHPTGDAQAVSQMRAAPPTSPGP
jgi:hypothetical protein